MKQYITKKQWEELNEEQREKLSLWVSKILNLAYLGNEWRRDVFQLTIGDMIEFLGDDLWKINFYGERPEYQFITVDLQKNDEYDKTFKAKELCDALWEACKYKLSYLS